MFGYRVLGFGAGEAPREEYTAEYLIVAGGGSGGNASEGSGGGGAGGALDSSFTAVPDRDWETNT